MNITSARRLALSGHVQGVGYRPFVYRLATELGIRGWVRNAAGSVEIHAEGSPEALLAFAAGLVERAPAIARPWLAADEPAGFEGHSGFAILASDSRNKPDIHVPPDYFACGDCLREMHDPADRRYGYPFINCTQCGPRYTLIAALPYDRPNTSMAGFPLCPDCRKEYEDPLNRRFHAEPVACPACGPHLEFAPVNTPIGHPPSGDDEALAATVKALGEGLIIAVKGVGGYHLMCDATQDAAVAELRRRKPRPAKPLAVMFPADGRQLAETVRLTAEAEALIESPERPIVLLEANKGHRLSPLVAPGLREVGCFLPYSPLHHLLLDRFGKPLVATSGNVSGEPVLTDNTEAQSRLAQVADAFLHHNRPIVRPADDPVYRIIAGKPRPIRLGRGNAPLELELRRSLPEPVLALGSHMKNTVCLAWGRRAVISPHIGELEAVRSLETMILVAEDLQRLYQVHASRLLVDAHPGYGYRRWAHDSGLPTTEITHHHAHASALAVEFPLVENWIVFAWDGVGLGEDGTLWGGEAFVGSPGGWRRAASLRPFRLPGGDKAGRAPWRSAAALLWESGASAIVPADAVLPDGLVCALSNSERGQLTVLKQAWTASVNSPQTSAVGRLFDAAAALTGVCTLASFEGEGPMKLEALATVAGRTGFDVPPMPISRDAAGVLRSDWSVLIPMLLDGSLDQGERAFGFHLALAETLVDQATELRDQTGSCDIGLTGGVFQNRLLTELAKPRLEAAGFQVHLPERVPVNDAGVSFGQVIEFLSRNE